MSNAEKVCKGIKMRVGGSMDLAIRKSLETIKIAILSSLLRQKLSVALN